MVRFGINFKAYADGVDVVYKKKKWGAKIKLLNLSILIDERSF